MKRLFSLLLVAATLLALTGCHGSRDVGAFDVPDEFDETRTYEITFWAKNDTNKTQVDIYSKAAADFEALYPNIKVNIRYYTDYAKIYNDVITNIATNTVPNVCITYPDHIATYLRGNNTVVPLDSLFDDEKFGLGGSEVRFDSPSRSDVTQKFLEECKLDGHYYALPFMRSTEACYVNRDLVEALGYTLPEVLTWDFIWEVSEAAMEKDADGVFKVNGQKVMIPFIYKSTDNMMIQMLRQKGAGYSDEDGSILIFNDTTKELLYEIAEHAGTRAFSTFSISSYPGNFLNAGQCIFAIDSTAGATWMGSEAPHLDIPKDQLVKFNLEVMAVPQFDTENPQMISQGPSVCVFNRGDEQEVLASWLFAQYLLTNEVQTAYSSTEGYVPVTDKARDSDEYLEYLADEGKDEQHYSVKIEAAKLLLENTDNTFVTPVWNGSVSLREAAGQLIENVTQSMRWHETVDEAYMEALRDKVTSLKHLDQIGKNASGRAELGKLPGASVALLVTLAAVWVLIGVYFLRKLIKKKKMSENE